MIMSERGFSQYPRPGKPGFYELFDTTPRLNLARRVARSYLTPRDPERAIRLYAMLGVPVVSKALRRSVVRLTRTINPSGAMTPFYQTNKTKGRVARNISQVYTYGGIAEVFHVGSAARNLVHAAGEAMATVTDPKMLALHGSFLAVNVALAATQRYNRARAILATDRLLRKGQEFEFGYRHWTGIDYETQEDYRCRGYGRRREAYRPSELPETPQSTNQPNGTADAPAPLTQSSLLPFTRRSSECAPATAALDYATEVATNPSAVSMPVLQQAIALQGLVQQCGNCSMGRLVQGGSELCPQREPIERALRYNPLG